MDFRLLGALEIDGQVGVLRRQERSLLTILLLRANESVSLTELIDLLWPDAPPADARGSLQVYLSRLRKALPGVTITSSAAGYAVQVDLGAIDVERFRRQVVAARDLQDPVLRSEGLRAALKLWRGEPLADLMPESTRERLRAGLVEEYAAAVEDRVEADLQAGSHEQVEEELAELVRAHPQRERLMVAWMTALYRSGRKPEALQAYADLADRLAEEFGLDPAPGLRRLHLAILRDDPALQPNLVQRGRSEVPRELPVDISLLVGRDELLADAVRVLAGEGREQAAVYCLWGGAGVGKSAAGTRIGHLVAEAFPDGRLLARLQDIGGAALPARTLLGRLLRSLGMSASQVPSGLAEREQAFRELTAERAVLVVLDDALDPETVLSLLPAGVRCAAIVTSRKPLPELTEAVHRQVTPLDPLTSRALLTRLIGRTLREQATVEAIADECVGLPLALRIVGSRLALSGDDALQTIAGALADDGRRLDSMVAGDLAVRTSLERTLTLADPAARQLLERLSLVGVTEFPAWVAAPLLDCDEPAGAAVFGRLVDLGLVELVTSQQYKMHALVRSYAAERLAVGDDPSGPRQRYLQAVQRLATLADRGVDHGMTWTRHLEPEGPLTLPQTEQAIESDATGWMGGSWPLVAAAAATAVRAGEPIQAGTFGLLLNGYLTMRNLRDERIELLEFLRDALAEAGETEFLIRIQMAAISAYPWTPNGLVQQSQRLHDLAEQAGVVELQVRAMFSLGGGLVQTGDYEGGRRTLTRAVELIERSGDLDYLKAPVLRTLAVQCADIHDYSAAEHWAEQAAGLSQPGSMLQGEALIVLGEIQAQIPEYDRAEQTLLRASAIFERLGSDNYVANTDALRASIAARRNDLETAEALLARVRARQADHPLWHNEIHLAVIEADLAIARGEIARGQQIRREMIERSVARGSQAIGDYLQHLIDTDDRDPANQR